MRAAAEHELQLMIRRVKRELDKLGLPLRYVAVISDMDGDTGETVRVHHHLVVDRAVRDVFVEKWAGLGGVDWKPLSPQMDYTPLASYLIRQVRRVPDHKKYISSRNLLRVEPKDRIAMSEAEVRVPKGGVLLFREAYHPGLSSTSGTSCRRTGGSGRLEGREKRNRRRRPGIFLGPESRGIFRHDDARTGAGMLSHARTRAHLRARGGNAPVSFAGQGIQAFFHAQKVDGSTHGHPVILVLETRAERGRPRCQNGEPHRAPARRGKDEARSERALPLAAGREMRR